MKLRNLYHWRVVRFRQHHEDFDYTENDPMAKIEIYLSNDTKSVVRLQQQS